MPGLSEIKSSWADEVEIEAGGLPPTTEIHDNGMKIVTEYKYNNDDKKVKSVRTYKITKQTVPKVVAKRKTYNKFGDSATDVPGPNSHTTIISEEIYMQFVSNKEEEKAADSIKDTLKNIAKCRICSGEHWSVSCPYKGTSFDSAKQLEVKPSTPAQETSSKNVYVPPSLRDSKGGASASNPRGRDDTTAIRISNLSESMTEADLEELVKKIGPYNKMYLARDKITGNCKGFAYVHFKSRKDAANAIECLNGHGYDYLILSVEWSKPQNN